MQAVHRKILGGRLPCRDASSAGHSDRKHGANLLGSSEIRKTSVMPTSHDQRTRRAWQAYLDNFATISIMERPEHKRLCNDVDTWYRTFHLRKTNLCLRHCKLKSLAALQMETMAQWEPLQSVDWWRLRLVAS